MTCTAILAGWSKRCALLAILCGALCTRVLAAELPEVVEYCLGCHGSEGFSMDLEDGSTMDLFLDASEVADSVHGQHLVCTDCHEQYDGEDHPSGATFPNRRHYVIESYEACKKCHFDTYSRTLESVHYEQLKEGAEASPVCTDCHGAHSIADPHEKRLMVSRSCAACHIDVYEQYSQSVHGEALALANIQTVPVCADCHTAHSIEHPMTVKFHLASPEICIRCHGDEELMAEYDIPTTVATTYLSDFHGVTASLAKPSDVEQRKLVVTCVDCHGVHDIASPKLVGGERMKAKVAAVCEGCHEGASSDFPAAWLSHFQPSLSHAPLVFLVELGYKVIIPFVVLGLILQVLLHFYRVALRR
jgi:predicted CXXCH cytochrome family protein